ncbi:protein RETICULATA-RELATED 6, chloroplastic isoform X2 [Capsicum annuum]|uniref:protein RETICULATA-RELATED 6, chloroplastic isoform X2 n=1 Tax=Capsicum annuum TaxID=4072 RepID=UPI001FB0E731|nr:protein RETICULATA-RELATED 6, chloroplastic isoform X2 [Capsicum annuum]
MKAHSCSFRSLLLHLPQATLLRPKYLFRRKLNIPCSLVHEHSHVSFSVCCSETPADNSDEVILKQNSSATRRNVLLMPLLTIGVCSLRSAIARADEKPPESTPQPLSNTVESPPTDPVVKAEEVINSRIYDATVIGEPLALGKDKKKVWEKLMNARVVYLGEAEQVPTRDDKELELEIVKNLRKRCAEADRSISLALEAFPSNVQEQLNQYLAKRIDGESLKYYVAHWPTQCWQEYEPLLTYCRDNGVRLVACGLPLEVLRTVQAEGIRGLSKADHKKYAPPAGSGFISGFTSISRRSLIDINMLNQPTTFGPSSYLSAQARVVEEYNMSQVVLKAVTDDGAAGLLVVVTGATHVMYGSRGTGVPARISRKIQKKNQIVILLDPERQWLRREGEVPVADFLWYSAARPCSRNCFDRAEIARVMNAAGRRRDALPQGFRERLLADPKFLHRLAIEESISITTTLLAQYEKRKENFFEELDYVITDTVRGVVVDFFTVWLPAPTISFLSVADNVDAPESIGALKDLLGSIPDNAFQKSLVGKDWNVSHRVASVLVGGLKLAGVGFISSIGAVASSNILYAVRKALNPTFITVQKNKRSPILKTALVYSSFLGTSANLRYQVIAGLVEHRLADQFSDQTFLVNVLSFVVRTLNSYWGTQQWIDLARLTGLQARKSQQVSDPPPDSANPAAVGCNTSEDTNTDEINSQ